MDEEDWDFGAVDEALAIYQGPRRTREEAVADLLGDLAAECQSEGLDFLAMAHVAAHVAADIARVRSRISA